MSTVLYNLFWFSVKNVKSYPKQIIFYTIVQYSTTSTSMGHICSSNIVFYFTGSRIYHSSNEIREGTSYMHLDGLEESHAWYRLNTSTNYGTFQCTIRNNYQCNGNNLDLEATGHTGSWFCRHFIGILSWIFS